MKRKPNILLIVMDQFRADLLGDGALGRVADLPNMRALMAESVSFSKHFSVVSPCGPSRVSLFTGQYARNHGVVRNGTPLRHDTPNLAKSLRAEGYVPQLFGYTDTAQDPRVLEPSDPRLHSYEELMDGFDETLRMRMETDDSAWRAHLASHGIDLPPYPDTYKPNGPKLSDPALYPAHLSDTAFLTDRFLDHMQTASRGWCAVLTYIRPHPPLVAPAPYNTMYDPAEMPPAVAAATQPHPFIPVAHSKQPPGSMVRGFPDLAPSPETTAALRALYLGLASEVDHHIGRIVDWLKSSGQWDNTLLVVTADHGEMLGDFGIWGKGVFHDSAFHVPLIIRDPARPDMHGTCVKDFSESIDIAATLLERIGAQVPDAMNGQSLLSSLDDVTAPTKEVVVSEYDFGHPVTPTTAMSAFDLHSKAANFTVLRTKQHRLTQFAADLPPVLFDMHTAGETRNIAEFSHSMPILLDLTRRMLCHYMTHKEGTFARTIINQTGVHRGDL